MFRREDIKKYIGETCKISLRNSSIIYTGQIIDINENSIEIIDKFRHSVQIDIESIATIESLDFVQESDKRVRREAKNV